MAPLTAVQLKGRLDKARAEGRFQQAVELSKELHARQPTPAHRDLLLQMQFGRAHQLRQQGRPREAETVLDSVLRLVSAEPAWLEKAAIEFAACGNVPRAVHLHEQLPEGPAQG